MVGVAARTPVLKFHRRYLALFQELTKPRYHVFTVDRFYHQGQRDPDKVQVVLRFDLDAGAGIAYELADYLHSLGLPASFYFLTRTATYPLDWARLRDLQSKGFEVGLHSDHYYEQLTEKVDGLELIKGDAARFSQELGAPVGMVWHGHIGMHRLKKCNWDLYRYTGPEELGLRYHDGVDGPYCFANVATWGPPADVYISDGMQQYLVLWRRYLGILRRAKPGVTVHLLLHPHRTVDWWKVSIPGETLPPPMTVLYKTNLYAQYGLMGLARSGWRLATRAMARGLALALYHLARLAVRERKPRSKMLDAAPAQAHLALMSQKPDAVWEEKVKNLGFSGLDTVLDLGAGPGRYTVALARLNQRVIAVEPLREYRASLIEKVNLAKVSNVEVIPKRAEDLDGIAPKSVSGVFCNSVLSYMDAAAVLRQLSRISERGARVYVSVHGLGGRLHFLCEAVKTGDFSSFNRQFRAVWNTFWSSYVTRSNNSLSYFTHRRLRKLLARHGFQVQQVFHDCYYWDDEPLKVAGFDYYFGVLARRS